MERTDWNQRYIDADTPWDSGEPSQQLQRFLSRGLVKPCRMLELGCGTGTNALYLAEQGFDVTAVDLSEEALRQAKEKAAKTKSTVKFVQADITAMPDLGAPFPFVFDRGTYHIVRQINIAAMQKMLADRVAPGGYYLVLAGNGNEDAPIEKGPPRVRCADMCAEIENDYFDLVSLEQATFDGVRLGGETFAPWCWTGVFRRRENKR
ncbi:MAG TPA: class I SAM-dependent methyltransferase [Planktothrix sp.]